VNGLKVSGNSAHIFRQKVLHHGTLLFSSDLAALENAISGRDGLFKDKAVGSIRSEVANIDGMLTNDISIEEFIILFHNYIFKIFNEIYEDELHTDEVNAITELAEKKYKSYAWNFGYSPEYQFHNEWLNKDGRFSVSIIVKEGMISRAEIIGPDNYSSLLEKIAVLITGTHHEKKSIKELREKLIFANASEQQLLDQIISNLF
jgi:lipoate-protein ligase A